MNITVLGGGNEVGASCLFIEIAGKKILIDAGMRMHSDNPLPALGLLEGIGTLDVILVTHAHADHIGALPIVHALYPDCPIYATPPTVDLMNIMMRDSYKLLEQRCRETNTLPPYTERQVTDLLQSLLLYPASGQLNLGDVKIQSYRAGHILGAVMFLIEGDGEKLFVTGDLSFKAGRTIHGAQVPHDVHPDVLIMESTYGNRAHTDRHTEETRLAHDVAEVVANGGFALIPAFALGRAQEVLLVLQDYMDKGLIPEFPIYVDGLVTPISRIYNQYPHYVKGPVAYRIKNNGDAFLTEGRCKAVTPKEREMILQGKPGCIVASSGMLIGGASSWYAQKLVADPRNAIFITGYQDEESPGKKLLNIADGIDTELELGGVAYPVKCRVGKYGLSAHADASEMNRFVQTLQPTYTLLVHGDDTAREQLSNLIDEKFNPMLVENGEKYPFEKRKSGRGVVGKRYRQQPNHALNDKVGGVLLYQEAANDPCKLAICVGTHMKTNTLVCHTLKGKQIKLTLLQVKEMVGYWNRSITELQSVTGEVLNFSRPVILELDWTNLSEGSYTFDELVQIVGAQTIQQQIAVALVAQALPASHADGRNVYLFSKELQEQLLSLVLPIQGLRLNANNALDHVRAYFDEHPRFIRCGADFIGTEKEQITIYFDFPDAISKQERARIAEVLRAATGWPVVFSAAVRQDLLQAALSRLLGQTVQSPSIHLQEKKVVVSEKVTDEVCAQFKELTGFDVQQKESANAQNSIASDMFQASTPSPRMENNLAIEEAKRWAAERNLTIYKAGVKQEAMEVHFISPQIAKRHEIELTELSYRIGMPVIYAKSPKQNEIIQLILDTVPPSWEVKKNPSLHVDRATVALKLSEQPLPEELQQIQQIIEQKTGYMLEVIV
ncbi:MBL fold metallo-hydrolase [Solibacillus silvestris]|uniref:MBL fold metallo-hydrolase n=1 Tax=Solibacillus silvestris TaxID=76853 RepID=UPI003F81E6E0